MADGGPTFGEVLLYLFQVTVAILVLSFLGIIGIDVIKALFK